MLVAWVLFPLVVLATSVGLGLLLERASGYRLPGELIAPAGLATLIVAAQPLTRADATAELIVPLLAVLGLAGLALLPGRPLSPDWACVACGAAVFAVFAAPFVLADAHALGGYVELDDTASWLAIADWVIHHGVDVSGLPPSTYEATLDFYLGSGYPVGGLLPLAYGGELLSVDLAWCYQPCLALFAAMLGVSLYGLARRAVPPRWPRAVLAFVAAQPAILFAYTLWGGFKEPAAAWLLALLCALIGPALAPGSVRRVLPLAVAAAAVFAVLSAGGALWSLPLLVGAFALAVLERGPPEALRLAAPFALALLVLSIPALADTGFLDSAAASTVTDQDRLANLIQPLSLLQVLGIWPTGEFRLRPDPMAQTYVLLAVAAGAGLIGVVAAWRRRRFTLLIYVAATAFGWLLVVALGSPWVDAKALATASPAFVLIALCGAYAVVRSGRRTEGIVLLAAIAGGVFWSNALAYRDVSLSPPQRFEELRAVGERIAGQGPTLMTEYEPYGVRWFLRKADPEGASELRRRPVALRAGGILRKGETADIDAFDLTAVLAYRTLLLRRSPLASRPPSPYRLLSAGRYYELWQRPRTGGRLVLEHLSLGGAASPSSVAPCSEVERLARRTPSGGRLAAAVAPAPVAVAVPSGGGPGALELPAAGSYELWTPGSFPGRLELDVDGVTASATRLETAHGAPLLPLARARLGPRHAIELRYHGADLHPGSGAPATLGGQVVAGRRGGRSIVFVAPARARTLCGRSLDWIEALAG